MAYTRTDDGGYVYTVNTAQDAVLAYSEEDRLQREDEARAAAAGVTSVDKIDYAAALRNYESRPDVELFINRRAREYADTFGEQDFTRQAAQTAHYQQSSTLGSTTVVEGDDFTDVTSPTGVADDPATATNESISQTPDGVDDSVIAPDRTE